MVDQTNLWLIKQRYRPQKTVRIDVDVAIEYPNNIMFCSFVWSVYVVHFWIYAYLRRACKAVSTLQGYEKTKIPIIRLVSMSGYFSIKDFTTFTAGSSLSATEKII